MDDDNMILHFSPISESSIIPPSFAYDSLGNSDSTGAILDLAKLISVDENPPVAYSEIVKSSIPTDSDQSFPYISTAKIKSHNSLSNEMSASMILSKCIQCLPFMYKEHPLFFTSPYPTRNSPPEIGVPAVLDGDPLFAIDAVPIEMIPVVLKEILELHFKLGKPLYLLNPPLPEFSQLFNKISSYFGLILPYQLVRKMSSISIINFSTLERYLTKPQMFVLFHVTYHFKSLLQSQNIYREKQKIELYNKFISLTNPSYYLQNGDFPLVSVMKVESSGSQFEIETYVQVIYFSPSNVLIVNDSHVGQVEFSHDCRIIEQRILFHFPQTKLYISLLSDNVKIWKDLIEKPKSYPLFTGELVVSSVLSFHNYPNPICIQALEGLGKMITTMHQKTAYALLNTICDIEFSKTQVYISNSKDTLNALFNVYSYFNELLRFYKLLVGYEFWLISIGQKQVSNLFRENNIFLQTIIDFIRRESNAFIKTHVAAFYRDLADKPSFNINNPSDEELENARSIMTLFWSHAFAGIDSLTPAMKSLMLYIRIMAELTFQDNDKNHKGIIGMFFLRILIPAILSPSQLGIDPSTEPAGMVTKAKSFSKFLMSLSTLEFIYNNVQDRYKFDPIIVENVPTMIKFMEMITDPPVEYEIPAEKSQSKFIDSMNTLIKFICETNELIRKKSNGNYQTSVFLKETVYHIFGIFSEVAKI